MHSFMNYIVVVARDHSIPSNLAPSGTPPIIGDTSTIALTLISLSAPLDAIAMELEPDNLVYDIRGHVRRRE